MILPPRGMAQQPATVGSVCVGMYNPPTGVMRGYYIMIQSGTLAKVAWPIRVRVRLGLWRKVVPNNHLAMSPLHDASQEMKHTVIEPRQGSDVAHKALCRDGS